MDFDQLQEFTGEVRRQIHQVVLGQDEVIDLMLVALLSDGHVLLEGVPGTAKTLLARAFATTLALEFRRIQFTPDLMPGDVIGTNLFNFQTSALFASCADRSSPTCCWPTRSTALRPRPRPPCWRPCRNGESPSMARAIR